MRKVSLVAALTLILPGCAANYVEDSNAPVLLRITGITPVPIKSDVLSSGTVTNDMATISLAVRSKNPNVTVPQVPMAVFMERYEIRYVRSDGRATEGVDVPYRITGGMTGVIDAQTSGSTDFPIEVVRIQAKLEPPLRNLRGVSTDTLGGSAVAITMFADITVYGKTVAGQVVSANGQAQIDFADYAQ